MDRFVVRKSDTGNTAVPDLVRHLQSVSAQKVWEVRNFPLDFWDRCGIFPVRNFPLRKNPRTEFSPPRYVTPINGV